MYTYAKKTYILTLKTGVTDKLDKNLWYFWLFFALICGIRWNVGVDSVTYMQVFEQGKIREDSVEHLWDILVLGVQKLNLHYTIGMAVTAFVQIFFTTKIASQYRYILVFLPIALFGGEYYVAGYCNAVRQMMAASIFVFSTQFILKKKMLHYLICIFAATQIHHSSQILYALYLLAYIRPEKISFSNKRIICTTIFITCFVLGLTPQFQAYAQYFSAFVDFFGDSYEYVDRYIQEQIVAGDNEARKFGPMMLSYFLSALSIVWFGPELKKEYKNMIPYFDLWWLFAYIYICGFFLLGNIGFMFLRPLMYFMPFQLLMTSLLLYYFYFKNQKTYFWALTSIIWVAICWNIMKSVGTNWESVTYKMFMFHDLYIWK